MELRRELAAKEKELARLKVRALARGLCDASAQILVLGAAWRRRSQGAIVLPAGVMQAPRCSRAPGRTYFLTARSNRRMPCPQHMLHALPGF